MRNLLVICIGLISGVCLWSCTDSCSENKNAIPLAGFYDTQDNTVHRISVSGMEIEGVGLSSDSLLSPASEAKEIIYLPFRIDCDTTSYIFRIKNTGNSTDSGTAPEGYLSSKVTFIYSRTPRLANMECGVSYIFDIREIETEGTLIDSVTCPRGFIDNANVENLHIYIQL